MGGGMLVPLVPAAVEMGDTDGAAASVIGDTTALTEAPAADETAIGGGAAEETAAEETTAEGAAVLTLALGIKVYKVAERTGV